MCAFIGEISFMCAFIREICLFNMCVKSALFDVDDKVTYICDTFYLFTYGRGISHV